MHYYRQSHKDVIHHFSKVTAIVLLSVTLPIVPLALTLQPLTVQAQTTQNRKDDVNKLLQQGL